ncbi:ATP-binding cassette domain-containing protein [Arsenicicoccus dermatophilus]|uniref:ATP-binding cassette domain-containing protein n=1 Tax=Arsenicicoccus dermatophilus TaxID=1076331 RepID=UPI0039174DE9
MSVGQVLSRQVQAHCHHDVAATLAAIPPDVAAQAGTATDARSARDAVNAHVSQHGTYVLNFTRSVATMAFLVLTLSQFSPVAAALLLLAVVPTLLAFTRVSRIEARAWPAMAAETKVAAYCTDQLVYERTAVDLASLGTGFKLARTAGRRHARAAQIYGRSMFTSTAWIALAGVVSTMLFGASLTLLARDPGTSADAVVAGVIALLSGMAATTDAAYTFGGVIASLPVVAQYRTFLDRHRAPEESAPQAAPPGAHALDRAAPDLVGRGLTYRYPGAARDAVTGVDLVARPGEIVAVVGINGAGKTTLVRLLAGILHPQDGQVLIGGRDLADLSRPERLARIGILSQEYGRYELTVRDTLLLGTPREDVGDDELWRSLELVGLDALVRGWEQGLDSRLGAQFDGQGLSGGQWQRLALARLVLRDSPIWFLDEPTSQVDAQTEELILDRLFTTRAGRVTVLVSHRAWTLRAADRIYVVDEGQVVQVGTYAELASAPGRFGELFRTQTTPLP